MGKAPIWYTFPVPTLARRSSGVLLHPTSLPGPAGAGDLGPAAHAFVDALADAGQSWWQMLPVGPTGYGNSPYSALSSFAGNPLLVSLEALGEPRLQAPEGWPEDRVPFSAYAALKIERLRGAFDRFRRKPSNEMEAFRNETPWLADWTLYRALKDAQGGVPWNEWEPGVRDRVPAALEAARRNLGAEIRFHEWVQFAFESQWRALRERCRGKGVGLIGDLPFYVPHDSAEVWAHPHLFTLGRRGQPKRVVGVPPDDFAKDGQMWGFPLYDWDRMREEGFEWWLSRLRAILKRFDAVRIDHFIGFHRAWAIPARLKNALKGRWVPGAGAEVLEKLRAEIGPLGERLIAEDLGTLTPEVEQLRDGYGLPGIRVLQFGFGWDPAQTHLPHKYPKASLAATGTHDNNTSIGWYQSVDHPGTKDWIHRYLQTDGTDLAWVMIAAVLRSAADTAVTPVQDLLSMGPEGRMNLPGVATGNWGWRLKPGALTRETWDRLKALTSETGRLRT